MAHSEPTTSRRPSRARAGLTLAAALAAALAATGEAAEARAAGLTPHKAIYDLSLADPANRGGIVAAEGRLVMELQDLCDDWASSERMVLRLSGAEGSRSLFDYRFSSLEAKDGGAYRFTTSTLADGREIEKREGRIVTGQDGRRVATFKTPKAPDLALPEGTNFPASQLSAVIAAAAEGRRSFEGLLFDGVSDKPLSLGAAAISPIEDGPEPPAGLEGLARWRVSAAYFELDEPDGRPSYEVTFDLYENGVAARMTMAYEDFTLNAQVADLSIRPPCAR